MKDSLDLEALFSLFLTSVYFSNSPRLCCPSPRHLGGASGVPAREEEEAALKGDLGGLNVLKTGFKAGAGWV